MGNPVEVRLQPEKTKAMLHKEYSLGRANAEQALIRPLVALHRLRKNWVAANERFIPWGAPSQVIDLLAPRSLLRRVFPQPVHPGLSTAPRAGSKSVMDVSAPECSLYKRGEIERVHHCLLPHWPSLVSMTFLLFGALLILYSASTLGQTWDESAHIGTGMEWLTHGTYTLDPIDPPLARVAVAIGPYLEGLRSVGDPDPWQEGNKILAASHHLHRTLFAARLAILPFFLIAGFLTWRITKRWLGAWPAAVATALFATCPPVLAHSSLATCDTAFLALFLLAVDRIWLALTEPSPVNSLLAGTAIGLACLSKLSAVPYLSICGVIFLLYSFIRKKRLPQVNAWLITFGVAAFTIWAGYHFTVGSLPTSDPQSQRTALNFSHKFGPLQEPVGLILHHFPAYTFVRGIRTASNLKTNPPESYIFGQAYYGGKWYFYPVVLLVKTPLPFLLLGVLGAIIGAHRFLYRRDAFTLVPLSGILFPVLVATLSHINLGLRHVLVVYPFLAMLAALAASTLSRLDQRRLATIPMIGLLLGWQVIGALRSSPDFLVYFNEPASPYATYLRVDSDFDWGQDINQLPAALRELHAENVSIAYSGVADLNLYGLPSWRRLTPGQKTAGWIAISETSLRLNSDRFGWLDRYRPIAVAGHTIRIYHLE